MKGSRQWNELRQEITEQQGFRCWYCGGAIRAEKRTPIADRSELDHKQPRRHGGDDERDNLVAACQRCNAQKCARTVEEYRVYLRDLDPHVKLFWAIEEFEGSTCPLPAGWDALRDWLIERWPTIRFYGESHG